MLGHVLAQGEPMSKLENVFGQDRLYPHPERLVTFFDNHDTVRFLSQPGATVPDLKLAFGLIATLRGMPQIYSGDEIAMRGGDDPDNRRDFPGGFLGDKASAFTAEGRTGDQAEVFDWTSRLMRFRAKHAALLTGSQQDIFRDSSDYAFVRTGDVSSGCTALGAERVLVVVNHAATHAR